MTLIEILSKLIEFKTLSANFEENLACLNWVKKQILSSIPQAKIEIKQSNKFPSLIFTSQNTKTPKLWLAGHLDVVPGSDSVFQPKIKDGKLYGRGAFDMKFAAACYLKLIEELKEKCFDYDFGIMLTTDEEVGGQNGVKHLLDQGYLSEAAILPDGGKGWLIEIGAKGTWHLKVSAKGKSAHGSRTWLGENAIVKLANFLLELQSIFPKEPCGDDAHWHATSNVGQISGGEAANKIPDHAEAFIDIRFRDAQEKADIADKLRALAKAHSIKISSEVTGSSYKANPDDKNIKLFSQIALRRFNIKTGTLISHGTSDGRYFFGKNIPLVMSRPEGDGHHTDEEWVSVADLDRFYEVIKEFVIKTTEIK